MSNAFAGDRNRDPKHFFRVDDAIQYGMLEAILLENLRFWIAVNRANGKNFHEERTWTYDSVEAYAKRFPYATPKQIRRALDKLVAKGVLQKARHAQNPWDRTAWYSFTDEELWVPDIEELQARAVKKPAKKPSSSLGQSSGLLPRPPASKI